MPITDVAPIVASIDIDAPPAAVWVLVSDLRNMARWSPQCVKTFVRGSGPVSQGSKLVNINRRGPLVWPTQSMVVRFVPETEIAFRVRENWVVWSYHLEPTGSGGTRLIEAREAPQGISDLSVRLINGVLSGVPSFSEEMHQGMQETLRKIKAEAEAS
ncbi:MAG: SRPBCC family protein [Actinomycetota bacterium]|nr:SRPBCC family protein [Actinomycetota bacterium]